MLHKHITSLWPVGWLLLFHSMQFKERMSSFSVSHNWFFAALASLKRTTSGVEQAKHTFGAFLCEFPSTAHYIVLFCTCSCGVCVCMYLWSTYTAVDTWLNKDAHILFIYSPFVQRGVAWELFVLLIQQQKKVNEFSQSTFTTVGCLHPVICCWPLSHSEKLCLKKLSLMWRSLLLHQLLYVWRGGWRNHLVLSPKITDCLQQKAQSFDCNSCWQHTSFHLGLWGGLPFMRQDSFRYWCFETPD